MADLRPKNLNLFTIRFPLPAIASIFHRVSGFLLFLFIPLMLWGLSFSFTYEGFTTFQKWSSGTFAKLLLWLFLMPYCYHLIAGIRHLLSDIHIGNSRRGGKISAAIVFIVTAILIILTGFWIW